MRIKHTLKKNKNIFWGIVIVALIFTPMLFLRHKNVDNRIVLNPDRNNTSQSKFEKMRTQLKGKKISSINKILDDSIFTNKQSLLVFAYSGFDCYTCVVEGFEINKRIDSILKTQRTYIIASNANISRDQKANEYQNFIYNDKKELVRRELKYFYTPVLISFDTTNVILDVYYPGGDNTNTKKKFIDKFINENRMRIN